MFDVLRYLKEFGIPYATGGKDISPGWLGISCPFCRDTLSHGGFNLEKGYYSCWRCGYHDLVDVIATLERIKPHEAVSRLADYTISTSPKLRHGYREKRPESVSLPVGSRPLGSIHKAYLKSRNFDPEQLEEKYGLLGTGPIGPYKLRIIAPIYLDGKLISYQGRDVTRKAEIPYKACPKDQEVIEHKNSLYNIDHAKDTAIVVEGIFDTWRIGDGAVATFGVGFRWSQVFLLSQRFKQVFLLYDGELKAQAQARKIVQALKSLGVEATNILLSKGDPAELSQDDVKRLKEELL